MEAGHFYHPVSNADIWQSMLKRAFHASHRHEEKGKKEREEKMRRFGKSQPLCSRVDSKYSLLTCMMYGDDRRKRGDRCRRMKKEKEAGTIYSHQEI